VDTTGLGKGSRIAPAVLGHRGSQMVVDASGFIAPAIDERTQLSFCLVSNVFEPTAVFLGFGTPNVFLMVPEVDGSGWQKFTAFMFYRQTSYVARKMERMQVGIYFELRNLPDEAVQALRREMEAQKGHRNASCANANARVLSAAGFTSSGRSIAQMYRPSHLAAWLWEHGLEYNGRPIDIRIVQAGHEVGDHFVGVWTKEVTSLYRTMKKKWFGHGHTEGSAPQFESTPRIGMSTERWDESSGDTIEVGISRPSWVGVWLSFLLGQRPIFSLELDAPIEQQLDTSLKRFPGKLNWVTKLKKYVLFSGPVVRLMRRQLVKSVDTHTVPRRAVVEMLRRSPGAERKNAFVYNIVLTSTGVHMARLENKNGRDRRIVNWILAKHLVVGGYDADVRFAGEAWCLEENGDIVVMLSRDSGTYKPNSQQLIAAAHLISELLEVEVRIVQR